MDLDPDLVNQIYYIMDGDGNTHPATLLSFGGFGHLTNAKRPKQPWWLFYLAAIPCFKKNTNPIKIAWVFVLAAQIQTTIIA